MARTVLLIIVLITLSTAKPRECRKSHITNWVFALDTGQELQSNWHKSIARANNIEENEIS